MSWAVKYRIEYNDINGVAWKHDIEEDGFAGSITELSATGDPALFEWDKSSDDIFDPIVTSRLTLNVYSLGNFTLTDLYSVDDMQFRVSSYQNDVLFWQGYIDTGKYSEPYEDFPYPVAINAIDGLDLLKNIKYYNTGTDSYYTDRETEDVIILTILNKLGIGEFDEFVNLYEESMDDDVDDTPMRQLSIDQDLFKDMYCYEVLENILKKYNSCIIMKDGKFRIIRPTELTGATVYGRTLTGDTKVATTYAPAQYIKRIGHDTTLKQIPGGVLMIQRPASKVSINQDYGNKDSWIFNWELKGETWDTTTFEGWTNSNGIPLKTFLPEENDGVVLQASSTTPNPNYLEQTFGAYTLTTTDVIVFSFDYVLYNAYAAGVVPLFGVKVETSGGHYLKWAAGDALCTWSSSLAYVQIPFDSSTVLGSNGVLSFESQVIGIPDSGSITVTLYGPYHASVTGLWAGFKNIQFYSTSDALAYTRKKRKLRQRIVGIGLGPGAGFDSFLKAKYYAAVSTKDMIEIVEKNYEKTNAINGTELDYDYILGDVADSDQDNVIEQFQGALATYVSGSDVYSTDWNTRGGSQSKALLDIIGDEIAYQYSRPKQFIQMPIHETGDNPSTLNIIGNFQDSINTLTGAVRKFIFNRGSYNTMYRYWMIDLIEMIEVVPDAPTGLALSIYSTSRIDLTWTDNSDNEEGFSIERSTDGINFSEIDTVVANTEAYSDTSCTEGGTYYYRVRSYIGTAYSGYTDTETETIPSLSTDPSLLEFPLDPPFGIGFDITTTSSWTLTASHVWITALPASGTGNTGISVSVDDAAGDRTGYIYISIGTLLVETVTVIQKA